MDVKKYIDYLQILSPEEVAASLIRGFKVKYRKHIVREFRDVTFEAALIEIFKRQRLYGRRTAKNSIAKRS